MILFYVYKNICNSQDDNYLCPSSHTVQVLSTNFKHLDFRKVFKRSKSKSKQHHNPS